MCDVHHHLYVCVCFEVFFDCVDVRFVTKCGFSLFDFLILSWHPLCIAMSYLKNKGEQFDEKFDRTSKITHIC